MKSLEAPSFDISSRQMTSRLILIQRLDRTSPNAKLSSAKASINVTSLRKVLTAVCPFHLLLSLMKNFQFFLNEFKSLNSFITLSLMKSLNNFAKCSVIVIRIVISSFTLIEKTL